MDFGRIRKLYANKHAGAHKKGSTFIQNHDLNLKTYNMSLWHTELEYGL